mmetsp:Transcript_50782/g.146512  ORF Transcript_50782/g.146512 Transcript_50782/m.146512 type:complete len:225 (-) Transcript_50782:1895-2569(-)
MSLRMGWRQAARARGRWHGPTLAPALLRTPMATPRSRALGRPDRDPGRNPAPSELHPSRARRPPAPRPAASARVAAVASGLLSARRRPTHGCRISAAPSGGRSRLPPEGSARQRRSLGRPCNPRDLTRLREPRRRGARPTAVPLRLHGEALPERHLGARRLQRRALRRLGARPPRRLPQGCRVPERHGALPPRRPPRHKAAHLEGECRRAADVPCRHSGCLGSR